MIRKSIIVTILWLTAFVAGAAQVRFQMSAPGAVEVGQQFRLTFTLNQRGQNLQLPSGLTDNFDVLMGPSTSSSTSVQVINGKTTSEATFSYTYILRAKQEGNFEIRPGFIESEGKVIESNALKIQVVKARQQQAPSQGQPQQQQQPGADSGRQGAASPSLGGDNLFLRVEMSKRSVYRGEQIIATVRLYADPNIPIAGFEEVNLPTYEGFYTQDIEIPNQINFSREVYNDRIYQVGVLKKTALFPQQNGAITITPFDMTLLVQQRVQPRSFFDDFFSGVQTVRSKIVSQPVTVNVRDLPPQPASFYGGVGSFSVNADISATDATTNDAVTLKVVISGTGNLRLVRNPELSLPSDFEVYDPRSTENIRTSDQGVSGTKTVEYLFQPRFEGEYTIPSIAFTFFNPGTGSYVTRNTAEYTLSVRKGADDASGAVISSRRREDLQLLGEDIRFIRQGNPALRSAGTTFYGTPLFYALYGGSTMLFLALFLVYRKRVRESANTALMRNRKANRVATRRLKAAAGYMKQDNDEGFHEAVLKAFWGYLSDKLAIPVSQLKRETAVAGLQQHRVDEALTADFVEIIERCEYARFAPVGGSEARSELYKKAVATMSRLEKSIRG